MGKGNSLGVKSNMWTEAKLVLEGLQMVLNLRPLTVCHASDSLILVHILMGTTDCPGNIWYSIQAINKIMTMIEIHMVHIYREGNSVTDSLADWSTSEWQRVPFIELKTFQQKLKGLYFWIVRVYHT